MKSEGKDLLTHTIFLIMISKSFFVVAKAVYQFEYMDD